MMQRFGKHLARVAVAAGLILACALAAAAGTVTGTVRNGTSGKPAAGAQVILIQLMGGMQPVANTTTDAQGNYKIEDPNVGGQAPMLIRAVYRGVFFHQPLPPGQSTANITVYDPTSDAKTVKVGSRVIVFQTDADNLLVGEEYALQNQSQPPLAYFDEKGDFNFEVPQGAELAQVASWGPAGMPVVQTTMNRGDRKYAIAYAFQPGDNGVRLSYRVPYAAGQATLHIPSTYPTERVLLVAPPTMQVSSPGFTAAGNEQGFNLYSRDAVPAGTVLDVSVSGTAPMQSTGGEGQGAGAADAGAGGEQAGAAGPDQVNGRASGPTIQALPDRLDSMRWILIAGFASLFLLGLLLVWRQPSYALAADAGAVSGTASKAGRTKPTPAARADSAAEVTRQVENSLDGLKDKLFRLELRRQAGTISEEQYQLERIRTEKILHELVQG